MQQLDSSRRFLYLLARCAAIFVAAAGVSVLVGWIVDNPFLRGGFSPEGITVKTNAGIGILCCGLSRPAGAGGASGNRRCDAARGAAASEKRAVYRPGDRRISRELVARGFSGQKCAGDG